LISIAIPVYGQQQFIATALESVRCQSVSYEVAVMDATPDDSVQMILDQYAEIIAYSRHGKDDGQSSAIQEGWDNTSGEIVAWLCADDYYFPNTLELVNDFFDSHTEVDVVYGDSMFVDASSHFKMYFPAIENDASCLPVRDCIAQPSCFVRRKALESVGGLDVTMHYIMDWNLWIRLYRSGAKFHHMEKCLSVTRVYPETKTNGMSYDRYCEVNHQLKQGASFSRRVRGLLGMFYCDLAENKKNFASDVVFSLLTWGVYAESKIFRTKAKYKYGLELWTNKIIDTCEINQPWYHSKSPKVVSLTVLPNVEVTLSVNGHQVMCNHLDKDAAQLFTIPDNLAKNEHKMWRFQLRVDEPCRLVSFVVM